MGSRLKDKVAVITGGSRGIGRAIASAMAAEGAKIVLNYYQDETAADEAVAEIERNGGEAVRVRGDVAVEADVEGLMQAALDRFGAVDILVNNAGISVLRPFLDISIEEWDRTHAVNLRGTFLCSQAAAKIMVQKGVKGRIISTSSIMARVGGGGLCAYAPTKAGQEALMRSMAVALGDHGITCNSVAPGTVRTDQNRADLSDPDKNAYMEGRVALGYLGDPADIAGPAVFLASDEASYITGETLLIDGGAFVKFQ